MVSAVIFDLFNTLIYLPRGTNPYWRMCRAIGQAQRLRESQVVDAPTLADFCDHLGAAHPPELERLEQELKVHVASARLFPDSIPALESLRETGMQIGLISNLATPYKQAFHNLGLASLIDVAIFSCDIGHAKPAPETYQRALGELDLPAHAVVMIGDSERADIRGPRACGIRGVLLDRRKATEGNTLGSLSGIASILHP